MRGLAAVLVLGTTLLGSRPLFAEVVRLNDLEQRALRERASLAGERARAKIAQERIELAGAPLRPTLAASIHGEAAPGGRLVRVQDIGGAEYLVQGSQALGSEGAFRPEARYGATLSLASRLYDFGRTASQVRAAEAQARASHAETSVLRGEVLHEVRSAYVAWLFAHGARDILRGNASAVSALRQTLEARVAEGVRPKASVVTLRHEEVRAALELDRGESELLTARLTLEYAAGSALASDAEPDYALLDVALPAEASSRAPAVLALERQRDAALATANAHRRARAPVLAGTAEAGLRGQAGELFPLYRVGIALSVPLLDGGAEQSSAAIATAQAESLAARTREARSRVSLERAQTLSEFNAAERRRALAQQLVEVAKESLRYAEDQRELGAGPFEEVIRARIQRSQAELELLSARVARARAALLL